jgi:hypothetical protein
MRSEGGGWLLLLPDWSQGLSPKLREKFKYRIEIKMQRNYKKTNLAAKNNYLAMTRQEIKVE